MKIIEIRNTISQEEAQSLYEVFSEAFHKPPSSSFLQRLNEKQNLSVLIAKEGNKVVGFKIGYQRFQGIFFSWLGAVAKEHQQKGIARKLSRTQHQNCLERGFQEIQTEAAGNNSAMLILNLKEKFEVYGTHLGYQNDLTVQLRKSLKEIS